MQQERSIDDGATTELSVPEKLFIDLQKVLSHFQHRARTPVSILQSIVVAAPGHARFESEESEDARYAVKILGTLLDGLSTVELSFPMQREPITLEELAPLLAASIESASPSTAICVDRRWVCQGSRIARWACQLEGSVCVRGVSCAVRPHREESMCPETLTNKFARSVWNYAASVLGATDARVALDESGQIRLQFALNRS